MKNNLIFSIVIVLLVSHIFFVFDKIPPDCFFLVNYLFYWNLSNSIEKSIEIGRKEINDTQILWNTPGKITHVGVHGGLEKIVNLQNSLKGKMSFEYYVS